jgi:hypothetical protein
MTTPDFESIYTAYESTLLKDAYDAITACDLWQWFRNYYPDPERGFIFSNHPNLDRIHKQMKLYDMHSGASYGWTMRQIESIAKRGWEEHRNQVRRKRAEDKLATWADQQRTPKGNPCGCRLARGYTSGWCGVAGGGVPACDH